MTNISVSPLIWKWETVKKNKYVSFALSSLRLWKLRLSGRCGTILRKAQDALPQGRKVLAAKYSSTLRRVQRRTPQEIHSPAARKVVGNRTAVLPIRGHV